MTKLYQITKGILAFAFATSGLANLAGAMAADMDRLGYPAYFSTIIGVAYFIAVIFIYQTKIRFLQEWAYGGMAASLVGATASHVFAGDSVAMVVPAFVLIGIFSVAYYSRYKINTAQ